MDEKLISRVTRQVVKTYPEMKGIKPAVRLHGGKTGSPQQFQLTFKGKAALPGGRSLNRIVRVTIDESGRILRMSSSK